MAHPPLVLALPGVNASGEGLRSEDGIFQGDTIRPGGDAKKDIFVPFDPFDPFDPFEPFVAVAPLMGVVAMFFF
jgi:hypothetical protein